jgi:hypothetical protein
MKTILISLCFFFLIFGNSNSKEPLVTEFSLCILVLPQHATSAQVLLLAEATYGAGVRMASASDFLQTPDAWRAKVKSHVYCLGSRHQSGSDGDFVLRWDPSLFMERFDGKQVPTEFAWIKEDHFYFQGMHIAVIVPRVIKI